MLCLRCWSRAILFVALPLTAASAQAQPMRPPGLPTPTPERVPGAAEPGYLGMVVDDRQENSQGVRVKDVDPESPAAKAGLQAEDLITAINGQPVHSDDDLGNLLRTLQAGAKVTFQVDRQGKSQNVEATLGRRPPPDQRRFQNFGHLPEAPAGQVGQSSAGQSGVEQLPAKQYPSPSAQSSQPGMMPQPGVMPAPQKPLLGVRTLPVTEQDRLRLGLPSIAGAHVLGRVRGSSAEIANLPLDSVVTAVDGVLVNTPSDLTVLLQRAGAGRKVEITYFYNGKSEQTNVILGLGGEHEDWSHMPLDGAPPVGSRAMANTPQMSSGQTPGVNPERAGNRSPLPLPPMPMQQQDSTANSQRRVDAQRIEALERRVQELEQKVQQLESRQQHGT